MLSCVVVIASLLWGCASSRPIEPVAGPVRGMTAAEADSRAEKVRLNPLGYLQKVAQRCAGLQQYTVTLVRQERRGLPLFQTLREPETIACWFRKSPFSVRMKWLDEKTDFGETAYVQGDRGDKVRFTPRDGFLGFPPGVQHVDMQTPVTWGVTKYPVSDFGLERLMQRTLDSLARSNGDYTIEYIGLAHLENHPRAVHHLKLKYPPSQYAAPIQELFVDIATDLPACTLIRRSDGQLDAAYYYRDVDPSVALRADDFLLEAERPINVRRDDSRGNASGAKATHAAQQQ